MGLVTWSLGVAVVNHCAWGWSGARSLHRSAPHLSLLLLLPAEEPAGHAPDRGLLGPLRRPCLLLAAALSLLEDEEPTPARGSVDPAAPPAPLQPLHHPLGDQYPSGAGLWMLLLFLGGGGLLCANVDAPSFLCAIIGPSIRECPQGREWGMLPWVAGWQSHLVHIPAGGGSAGFFASYSLGFLIYQMQSPPWGCEG